MMHKASSASHALNSKGAIINPKWLLLSFLVAIGAGSLTYYLVNAYIMNQAQKNVRDILLSHRGVHHYIQRTMHPEFYRARTNQEIAMAYYVPEILSSSFMVRVLHGYYNEERQKAGLPQVYYKMAADNPRNPVNKADENEEKLLAYFREHPDVSEFSQVQEIDGKHCLVFAMPFLRTEQRCLVCHGKPEDAPIGLQARYPNAGGYGDTVGNLRAIESLRVPIEKEQFSALVGTLAMLAGLVAIGGLSAFNRVLNQTVKSRTEELSSREITFRRLLEATNAAPFEYLPGEDRYTFVGPQYRAIVGAEPDTLKTGKDLESIVHPDDRDTALHTCRELTQQGKDHDCELKIVRADGSVSIIHQTINLVKEEGKPLLVVGFMHDVTSLRRNEAIQKARLTIAENSLALSMDDLIKRFLDEVERLTHSHYSFFHFVDEERHLVHLQQWSSKAIADNKTAGKGKSYVVDEAGAWKECIRTRKLMLYNDTGAPRGKNAFAESVYQPERELLYPIKHAGKIVALLGLGDKKSAYDSLDIGLVDQLAGIVIEAILHKGSEEERQRIQEQLVQAQKVESIGRLAGGVAHDFNNMLNVIMVNADLSMKQSGLPQSVYDSLDEIQKAAQRSAGITRQLLAFARKQVACPKVLDLNETIESMLRMLRRLIGEDIEVVWHPGVIPWKIKIDPTQIDQILANLATNSRDAINGVGRITVETQTTLLDEEYCRNHPGTHPGKYALLIFSDNGCGIPKDKLNVVFEPFYTSKGIGRGTGLGLATVLGIVNQNGGAINVYSELGKGTTFKIYLPKHAGDEPVRPVEPEPEEDLSGNQTLLIVEDEASILKIAGKILSGLGYKVHTARNCAEAIQIVQTVTSPIHLLITDVILPDMNGRELFDRVVQIKPDIKCLYMSGYTANVIVHRGILLEGLHFMQKPFTGTELASKVKAVLRAGSTK